MHVLTLLCDLSAVCYQPILLNGIKQHCITPKVLHALLVQTHCNRIAWIFGTIRSSARKYTEFAICAWGVVNFILTPTADQRHVLNVMREKHGMHVSCTPFQCTKDSFTLLCCSNVFCNKIFQHTCSMCSAGGKCSFSCACAGL